MRFFRAVVLAGLSAFAIQAAQADIHVGVTLPLTGPGAALGLPARNALSMWPQEIAGHKIVQNVLDDGGDPATATKNARRFAEDKVDLIVGSANTLSSLAVNQVANEARVLQLSPSPIELPEGRDAWTFRAVMHAAYFAEGVVDHMKRAGIKTVGFMGVSDAYGESCLQAFNKFAQQAGIKVVAVERFTRADASVAGQTTPGRNCAGSVL